MAVRTPPQVHATEGAAVAPSPGLAASWRAALAPWARPVGRTDVLALESCGSLWLFDLDRVRFQRLPRGDDPVRAARYGTWETLADLAVYPDGTFTVTPARLTAPVMRSRAHAAGCSVCGQGGGPVTVVADTTRELPRIVLP